jgi:hypothetical protein
VSNFDVCTAREEGITDFCLAYSQREQRPLPGAYVPRTRRDYAMIGTTKIDLKLPLVAMHNIALNAAMW